MLPVPLGGAALKVKVVPETLYVDGSCSTPVIETRMDVVVAGATDIVNVVVDPVPLKVSVTKAMFVGDAPI